MQIAEILASHRKSGPRNMMVMPDFRPKVEIWPFCAHAVKIMEYNPYLWCSRQNSHFLQETGVEEHDGDVRL